MRRIRLLPCALLALALSACEAIRDASDHAADNSKKVLYDTKERWRDLLTYKPRESEPKEPLSQTRYCYRMQMDIVCYDTVQVGLTAPLVGYQDGDQFSWFKKGGGSFGFSAPHDQPAVVAESTAKATPFKPQSPIAPSPKPGEIEVKNKPKPAPKKDWVK